MSSRYDAICIAHTPVLIVDEWSDHHSADEALTRARHGPHRDCALMVGRRSGGLVEVGCPPDSYHPNHTKWVDAMWVRVAALALDVPYMAPQLRRLHLCFGPERLRLLRPLLIDEEPT